MQVKFLINEATDLDKLANMYYGWAAVSKLMLFMPVC